MKNVGVPFAPSSRLRGVGVHLRRPRVRAHPARSPSGSGTPACWAQVTYASSPRSSGWWNTRLRKRQNASSPARACTPAAASAAERAFAWTGRGLFFQTMRTLSGPYAWRMCASVGSARAQNGHWKSANSTIVTGAVRLPQVGSAASIGTPASSSGALEEPGATGEPAREHGARRRRRRDAAETPPHARGGRETRKGSERSFRWILRGNGKRVAKYKEVRPEMPARPLEAHPRVAAACRGATWPR